MKYIIEIDSKILEDAKKGYVRLGEIADAVKTTAIPYNPSGDCISREALKKAIEEVEDNYDGYEPNDLGKFMNKVYDLIDNATTVHPRDNYDLGYVQGLTDMKSDIITLIANEYTSHGELIPNWLTIGETKVSDRQKKGGAE